jgi:hypothetical protein
VADRVIHELAAEPADAASAVEPVVQTPVVQTPVVQAPVVAQPTVAVESQHAGAEAALKSDPLHAVIIDILQGWGDVADDDAKRLAVFRPDKVAAALQALELPKELKSSQSARNRLMQLRRSATELVEQERQRASATTAAPLPASAIPEPAGRTEPAPFFSLKPQPPAPDEIPAPTQPEAEPAEVAQPAIEDIEWLAAWQAPDTAGPEVVPASAEIPKVENPPEAVRIADAPPLEIPLVEVPFVEVPPVAVEIPRAEPESPPTPWVERDVETGARWQEHEAPLFEIPGQSFTSLPRSIKTADELLSLPVAERADMVTFLEPTELSKVFERTEDFGLKKAIIDTLEHVSNPASLEVLRKCLDDPDPQIQLYALEAADRLLGVD